MSPAPLLGPFPAALADCESIATCYHSAFSTAQLPLYRGLWGQCQDGDVVEFHVETARMVVLGGGAGGRSRTAVVKEGAGGLVVGYVMWTIPVGKGVGGVIEGRIVEQGEEGEKGGWEGSWKEGEPRVLPQGHNEALMKRFEEEKGVRQQAISKKRDETWYIHLLATRPGYEGRGVAKKLVKCVMDQADRTSEVCLVSTDKDSPAFHLYEGLGFRDVGPITMIQMEEYGVAGMLNYVTMIRYPRKI